MESSLGYLAAIANITGFVLYLRAMHNAGSSSAVGWFLSAVLALSAAVAQFTVSGSFAGSASYFFGAACCASVFLFSAKRGLSVVRADKLTAAVALVVALLAFSFPAVSIYFLCCYYLLTYSVFSRAILAGAKEPLHPWLTWCVSAVLQLLSLMLSDASVQAHILPLTNLACWSAVAFLVVHSKRKI